MPKQSLEYHVRLLGFMGRAHSAVVGIQLVVKLAVAPVAQREEIGVSLFSKSSIRGVVEESGGTTAGTASHPLW